MGVGRGKPSQEVTLAVELLNAVNQPENHLSYFRFQKPSCTSAVPFLMSLIEPIKSC